MMAFVDTFVCVHKEELWTHPNNHGKGGYLEGRTFGGRKRNGERLWKRRWCREPRSREWHGDTT